MAKTATDLLNELAQRDLVPGEVVASLRAQVAKAARPVPPQQITKLLVEKGHLTAAQAQKLLGAAPAAASSKAAAATATKPAPKAAPKPGSAAATQPIADDLTALDDLGPLESLESLDSLETLADFDTLAEPAPAAAPAPASAEPLESLGDADLLGSAAGPDPLAAAAAASLQRPAPQKPPKPAAAPRSPTTTALLALNGVALVGILAAAAFAFMPRANGDAEFQAAEGAYAAKDYAAAVEQYQMLLENYAQHRQTGLARVHQGLAKMHLAAGNSNWPQLLPVAKQVLAEIGQQPQLAEAQAELAPLVSNLAIGLAEQAAAGKTPEQIAAAREALALADSGRYVPGNLRPWQKLAAAKESLAVAEYQLAKDGKLQKSIAAIKQSMTAKKLGEAHAAREELLAAYPELDRGPALAELGKDLTATALAAIQKVEVAGLTETAEGASPTVAVSTAGSGPMFFAVSGGQLWALDAAQGSLRWRRPVGGSWTPAVRTGSEPAADVVAIDAGNSEVVRLAASNGALRWRRGISELLLAPPQIAGSQIVVAAGDGRVIALDAATGKTQAAVQLPVAIRAAPLVSGGQVIVVADSLYCFTLNASDLSPQSAAYLGHAPASATVPPIALPQHKVVVENRGVSTAVLHVLGGAGSSSVQELAVGGSVTAPLAVVGSRLVVPAGGGLTVFDITADAKTPLKKVAEQPISATYVVERAGKALVGGAGVQQCDLTLSGRALEVKPMWGAFPAGVCTSPPQASSDAVFCVRREPNTGAAIAAALRAANGQPLWETRLSLPEAAP